MREAWKRETYVRSQSFSSESAVKYLHVGRRKIQISPRLPLGEQGQSIALPIPKGQQRQSNARPPHALPPPPPPPAGMTLIGALRLQNFVYKTLRLVRNSLLISAITKLKEIKFAFQVERGNISFNERA